MLLCVRRELWSIIDDSGFVVSSVVSANPALLSFHMLAGNLDRARGRQCWQAYVRVQGRLARVGEFPTEREAAQARDQRVLALGFSPLVRLNFPGEHERAPVRR
jgi:hypothetical protein